MDSQVLKFSTSPGCAYSLRVYQGGSGPDLLYLHGAGGLLENDPFLDQLSKTFRVTAPLLPGYGDSEGMNHLRDMLDFTLHAFDVWTNLSLENPLVVGHSMGGMIAAEMASIAPDLVEKLVLLAPAGLWLDDHPVADIFATLPYELPELLLHDANKNSALLSAGGDLDDPEFLTEFLVGNARRLGMASKILFPLPERGLSQRLYRVKAETAVIWGTSDRLIPPIYADAFVELIPGAIKHSVEEAGHMLQYEQTETVMDIIRGLHN